MPGLIREDDIALVRERADIVETVGQYVTLKPAGGGALKGLCPFHDEKSPSFHVRPGKGFHCFGCSEGGDVISFLMKHDGLTFQQAVEYLAGRTGVQLRYTEGEDRTARSGGIRMSSGRPVISSAVYPKSSTAPWFQLFTSPSSVQP